MAIVASYSTPADGTAAIYTFITFLLANGWVMPVWSDGTTLTTPGAPLTANPYGSSSSGAGNLGNTSAWFRLTSPSVGGLTREWLFQRGAASQTWTVSRGRGGFTTGGTASVVATDATSHLLLNNGTLWETVFATRLLMSVDTVSGAWIMFTVAIGGGNVRTFLCDEALAAGTYPAADTDPFIYAFYYNATGINVTTTSFGNPSAPFAVYKRTRHGLSGASNSATTFCVLYQYGGTGYAPATGASTQVAPEPYSSTEVPIQIPVFKPGATGTGTGWCGFTNLLRWSTVFGRSNAQTLTDGTNYWIYMAGMWCPWDSSVPVI